MRVALAIAMVIAACGVDEEEDPRPPTCEELGAAPDEPLFCSAAGLCTFEGETCTRIPEEP